jgi:hypothetical protein
MPITLPQIDDRRYQQLLDDALARIPVHTPEWTNFNKSDPGVTLVEVFAFLTESLLYRANQIPERNRKKFLQLLGLPLNPSASARGLVSFINDRGPLETLTLNDDIEVRAGQISFRTELGLDVLPIEALPYVKQKQTDQPAAVVDYYAKLYASYTGADIPATPLLYASSPLASFGDAGFDLASDSVDHALWVALLARTGDDIDQARDAVAGKTLNLALVPMLDLPGAQRSLAPLADDTQPKISIEIPKLPASGGLPSNRQPSYRLLTQVPAPTGPVALQITLPAAPDLALWNNLDPLEPGVGNLPPTLEDTGAEDRVITWLRLTWPAGAQTRLLWAGINTVFIAQRTSITNELLPQGNGQPDQTAQLTRFPLIPASVVLTVTPPNGAPEIWQEIDDLGTAGPEVPLPDPVYPPGISISTTDTPEQNTLVNVFSVDAEAGVLRFGDGLRGRRPADGAELRVSYDYGLGKDGNVRDNAIKSAPALPAGLKVINPVRTWGGVDAESVGEGEKQIVRTLQHRDRLVTKEDFDTITRRTPGVELGRVDVLPLYHPQLSPGEPGDAPGVVTLMLVPKYDHEHPDAPLPSAMFLDSICQYLEPRRLVTTEVFLRGPTYRDIWISIGINIAADRSIADTRAAVEAAIRLYLSPLPPDDVTAVPLSPLLTTPVVPVSQGWPLRTPVTSAAISAVAARVLGVISVDSLSVALDSDPPADAIPLRGLELPRIAGIAVVSGPALDLDSFRGTSAQPDATGPMVVPIPVIPREC